MNKIIKVVVLAVAVASASEVWAANYKIDAAHSSIGFSVKHMMVSNTTGQFNQFDGVINYDPADLAASSISVTIPVSSIDTRNENRDTHLKSPDFFDTATFADITFVSKEITASAIIGTLTIKGVSKEVSIPATIAGPVKAMGKEKIGINAAFTLNRQDYGITWNKALDQGGVALADEVNVNISIEADLQ